MKKFILLLTLLASVGANATTLNEIFGQRPTLEAHSASAKVILPLTGSRAHRTQTVKDILVKLSVDNANGASNMIEILVKQKNAPAKKLRQAMVCNEYNGKVSCAVDCDGGSVEIAALEEGQLTIVNNGFILKGGCGEEEDETVYLNSSRGGDDVFVLNERPMSACKDVPFPRN